MASVARPVIVVTEHLHAEAIARLERHGTVVHVPLGDPSALHESLRDADAIVVRSYTQVDESLLDRAPRLKVVGRAGVGLDAIDVLACRTRGIEVVHTPDANSFAVVGWVLAMVLGQVRPLPRVPVGGADTATWRSVRESALAGRAIESMTVGVVGFGRVGTRVAAAFSALGAEVLVHDVRPIDPAMAAATGVTVTDAATLQAGADLVTLHVDGRPGNRHLYDADRLATLRDDVILVNASRGIVVDADALRAFLDARPSATALLDVHDPEPVPAEHPLLGHPRAILTPHVASRTEAAQRAMSNVVDDVLSVLAGGRPRFPAPTTPISE